MTIWYDILLIFVIFFGVTVGFNMGMVRQIFSFAGLCFGLIFASYFLPLMNRLASNLMGEAQSLAREAILFFIVFALIWGFINLGIYVSFRQPPRFLPDAVDRLVGSAFGVFTGILAAVIITLLLSYSTAVTWPNYNGIRQTFDRGIAASTLSPVFLEMIPTIGNMIEPLLPYGLPSFFVVSQP